MEQVLDNPIWHALTTWQAHLAMGDTLARRFPADIGPLAGMVSQSADAYRALSKLYRPDEALVLFLNEPASVPADWTLDVRGQLTQMVCEQPLPNKGNRSIAPLSEADVPDMLALTRLTKPGPFRDRTLTLGGYVGIRDSGRLAAMAGERLHLEGYTEISAVCTHPDFQGKGYAQALVAAVANAIVQRSEIPFLHTGIDNQRAIRVYEALGFRQRRVIHLAVLRHTHATHSVAPPTRH